jgi:hypothetical protein
VINSLKVRQEPDAPLEIQPYELLPPAAPFHSGEVEDCSIELVLIGRERILVLKDPDIDETDQPSMALHN